MAEHIKLKAKRVIKCVSKEEFMYQQFLTEATLLKNLKHPSIPIIYDLEEDEEYLYIIEEYIEGESLKELIQNHTSFQRETIIHIIIQICNIMEYLHNIKPYPVLYLDLKPDHIIVCNESVKIIDFGAAIYMEKQEVDYSFGTPNFAAPEQFNSLKLDVKADIYAIGCIMYVMLTGKKPVPFESLKSQKKDFLTVPTDLRNIVMNCMAKNPKNRYENVASILKELSICQNKKNALILAVAGGLPRVGVSHIAIAMVTFLNKNKIKTLYEEKNHNPVVSYINVINDKFYQKDGIYHMDYFEGIPNYNETIAINKTGYEVIVKDFGTYEETNFEFHAADIKLIVLGTKEWELYQEEDCVKKIKGREIQFLYNLCERRQAYEAAKYFGITKGYCLPYFSSPFQGNAKLETVFKDVLKDVIQKKRRTHFKYRYGKK